MCVAIGLYYVKGRIMTKVYIDGQSGTTGLQIYDRIGARGDLELLRIDEDKRHDIEERRRFLNAADDAGGVETARVRENNLILCHVHDLHYDAKLDRAAA